MTKYYCRGNVCKMNHKGRHLCCWHCLNFQWCDDMGEWRGCQPWMCGKSTRVSDHYERRYESIGRAVDGAFPVRKYLKRRIIRGRQICRR